jgi:signal peptidase I
MVRNGQAGKSKDSAYGLAEEILDKFGSVRLRLMGTSMVPSILPGDLVTIRHASWNEISPGEVVLFTREEGFTVHRFVNTTGSASNPCLVTRGDRLRHNDPLVPSSALLGRVACIERYGRRFQPATRLNMGERLIAPLLRFSDRATYLYLRLVEVCEKLFPENRSASRENCRIT